MDNEKQPQNNDENKDFLKNVNNGVGEGFQEEKFVYQKSSNIKWLFRGAFVILLAVIVFFFLNQKITVIDFTEMTVTDVSSWGSKNSIVFAYVFDYSSEIEEDRVIAQSIAPGEKISKNSDMKITLSDGLDPYEKIEIPDFDQSWSKTSITRWLDQYSIDNFTIKYIKDENVEEDYMISYRLIGAKADDFTRSSEIEFTIREIEDDETVTMQDFLNRSLLEVDIWTKQNGVEYEYSYEASSIYAQDKIISQSIDPDDEMNVNDTLRIVISTGSSEVTVNDFLNRTVSEVDTWAKNNKINYTLDHEFSTVYPEDKIISQSILPGDTIEPGSTIEFTVSKGEKVIVPDFSRIALDDINEYMDDFDIDLKEVYQSSKAKDKFISQSISAGSEVTKGSDITLKYSLGNSIYLSDHTNMNIVELEDWIYEVNQAGANLVLKVTEVTDSEYEKGKIITQDIYNEKISLDQVIKVTISVSSMLTVPDFSTLSEQEILSDYHEFDIEIISKYKENTDPDDFISQTVQAGTMVEAGTDINIEISLGSSVKIGDHRNRPLSELSDWVDEQNETGADLRLTVYEEYNWSVNYGDIVSVDKVNQSIGIDDEIRVMVSLGEKYIVADFEYMTKSEISNYARVYGLNIIFEEEKDPEYDSGEYIRQSPDVFEEISKNDFITIWFAK